MMSYNRAVRVFTDLKSQGTFPREFTTEEKYVGVDSRQNDAVSIGAGDRHIVVTGVGELTLQPDRFSLTITCKSSKENVQDAKNSVRRRLDYIVQTLKNYSLTESDYRIYQHVQHSESMVNVSCEIEAHFTDLNKCQSVSNLLAEKLGPGVTVSLPGCYHARGSLDKLRRQIGMLAIHNARQKALEMANILHLAVGPAHQVQEIEATETQGISDHSPEEPDLNPSIQQRIADSTVSAFSKVSVCFMLKPKSKKSTKMSM
ncbi:unnamed protein product [Candidula unifasciata]|uniref:Interleukin-1 receptor-associated kinase 1-binding protein 1 n=1 Tax=Candidula unifasciata TaxID=100452 RepID=A0A8S3Z4N2_9EUPU|nr:unnamed protein product [Candidula unifasciata]